MNEIECLDHLVNDQFDLISVDLGLTSLLLQQVQQRLMHQFENQKDLLVVLETVQKLYNVWVTLQQLQHRNLALCDSHRLQKTVSLSQNARGIILFK